MFGIDNMHNSINHIIKSDEKYQINKSIISSNDLLNIFEVLIMQHLITG